MQAIPEYIESSQVKPQFDKLMIMRERPERTKGGIYLTDAAQDYLAQNIGRVAAVGPSADESLKVGQVVIFGRNAGDWQRLPGSDQEVFFALDVDIIAIVEE